MPGPRPAGAHKGPACSCWACVWRPDAASSRGRVFPPASRRPSAAHLTEASGVPWAAGGRLRNCHSLTAASGLDSPEVLPGPTSGQAAAHASCRSQAPQVGTGGAGQGLSLYPSGKCSSRENPRMLGRVVRCPCLRGEAPLSSSLAQTQTPIRRRALWAADSWVPCSSERKRTFIEDSVL